MQLKHSWLGSRQRWTRISNTASVKLHRGSRRYCRRILSGFARGRSIVRPSVESCENSRTRHSTSVGRLTSGCLWRKQVHCRDLNKSICTRLLGNPTRTRMYRKLSEEFEALITHLTTHDQLWALKIQQGRLTSAI